MPRYLVLDRQTGHVLLDTDEYFMRKQQYWALDVAAPETALKINDTVLGLSGLRYREVAREEPATYDVYRADISGPDDLPSIDDGEDPEILAKIALGAADYVLSYARVA